MTELEGNCSLAEYSEASRILHMTSNGSIYGPWTVVDVALEQFAHNPNVVRDIDGAWLLFHIGYDFGPYCATSCASGKPVRNTSCPSLASHGSSVARATSPNGPWERVPFILPDSEYNLSVGLWVRFLLFGYAAVLLMRIRLVTLQTRRTLPRMCSPMEPYSSLPVGGRTAYHCTLHRCVGRW